MTANQADLFFIAPYIVTALLLGAAYYFHGSMDVRKSISRKTFLKRFLLAVGIIFLGVAAMTGVYLLHLSPDMRRWVIGGLMLLMSVLGNTILFASWAQRCGSYPRGRELSAVLILMYMVADLFMPSGVKYAVAAIASLAAYFAWEDKEK